MKLLQFFVTLAISILSAVFTAKISTSRWGGSFPKLRIISSVLSALAIILSILFDGFGMSNVQTVLLCCIFLYVSYGDIKTHEADDFIHVIVMAVALISKPADWMLEGILAAVALGGIMLLIAVFVRGAGIGGADIKFTAACGFLTTLEGGFIGLGLGTFAALLLNSPFRKKAEAEKGYPMLPYLSCAYMIVHLLL